MAKSVISHASPEMLKWARETANLSIQEVAVAEKVSPEKLAGWESGHGSPTLAKLRKLAKRYKRPTMVFYLESPPTDFTVVKDFRILTGVQQQGLSLSLVAAIRLAQERQTWASDVFEDIDTTANGLVGSLTLRDSPTRAAERIRSQLGVNVKEQLEHAGRRAFAFWRDSIERAGVFVFQTERVAVEEMRGVALPDGRAPAILLNSRDAMSARLFTLLHELGHILLGTTAVSGAESELQYLENSYPVEEFCNRFAAQLIAPPEVLAFSRADFEADPLGALSTIAQSLGISRSATVFRLVELGHIARQTALELAAQLESSSVPTKRKEAKPIQRHRLVLSRCGRSFSRLAVDAFHLGTIHGGELSHLLGMKLNHLKNFEAALFTMRAA